GTVPSFCRGGSRGAARRRCARLIRLHRCAAARGRTRLRASLRVHSGRGHYEHACQNDHKCNLHSRTSSESMRFCRRNGSAGIPPFSAAQDWKKSAVSNKLTPDRKPWQRTSSFSPRLNTKGSGYVKKI